MNKPVVYLGIATFVACCVCSISAGTLKAAAAEAISDSSNSNSKFEARGILNSPLYGNEVYGGPPVIALALPIALILVVTLWIAAYNTLRSPPPKIGYNAGIVESAGWGGAQGSTYAQVSGGWGYDAAAIDPQASLASNVVAQTVAQSQTVGQPTAAGVAASSRAFDELTHRVQRSIERHEKAQH